MFADIYTFLFSDKNNIGTYTKVKSKNATINIHNQCNNCSNCSKKSSNSSAASIEDVDGEDDISNDGTIIDREKKPLMEDLKVCDT